MMTPEQIQLVEHYVDGKLAECELEQLEKLLVENGEARAMLRSLSTLDFGLHALSAGSVASEEMCDSAGPPEMNAGPSLRVNRFVVPALGAVIAACLLIALGVVFFRKREYGPIVKSPEDKGKVIATLVQAVDVHWHAETLDERTPMRARTLSFESGIVRLRFVDGVEVTLEGPAEYKIVDVGKTELVSGVLAATVPPGAEGFRVDTPTARVVDLGTAFGIEQTKDGRSTVSVFDGEVEVITTGDDGERLVEGEAIQLTTDGRVRDVEFSAQPFEKLWPAASGIAGSSGAFQFAPQWPRRLRRVESDTEIFVLPEGYPGELAEPCPINMTGDGLVESVIPAGQRVRSFLLQFNPVDNASPGPNGGRRNGRRIEGSVTFAQPIVGLIINTDTLNTTDVLFGLDRAGGLFGRGLELRPPRIADEISLSEDRRTLTLRLFVVDRLSDHVRVIVDAGIGELRQN